ncbi:flavin monoamine oxidase family protein [Phyllobacterium lublinensis]|uniref:flavin monoamine oxidase family protein n=1 Tax=Phyllobacterium lublinensis TaxID=2875708 RepID=UPI001CCACC4E|nr:FAD-dependent oxidoreductase [Phyllobacterium sp. 2063]MBZ9657128.1 FAD-dependent oxidoreductase [Phyllobacterium sp. 2063]
MSEASKTVDVVVVGAGFAGLSAATELQRAGVDFVVLEAQDRAGGRVEAANSLGGFFDTGGQFLCDDMPEVMALARKHGKTLVETPARGRAVVLPHESGDIGRGSAGSFALRQQMRHTDPDDPALESMSVRSWVEQQPADPLAREMFLCMIEGLWCQPADRMPIWYLISNDRRITSQVSELQYFLHETMFSLADDMARSLPVVLNAAVKGIETTPAAVLVRTATTIHAARQVILAVPPVMAARIAFNPPLAAETGRALAAWQSGLVIKVMLRYADAFWQQSGSDGSAMWLDPRGIYVCNASHDDGHPALVMFVAGSTAMEWHRLGPEGIRQAVLAKLAAALGPAAAQPLDVLVRDWTDDPWSGGGYSDVITDMSATDAEEVLRRGAPRIVFAPSEISPSFPGYVEGAIVAGRIGANRAIAALESYSR